MNVLINYVYSCNKSAFRLYQVCFALYYCDYVLVIQIFFMYDCSPIASTTSCMRSWSWVLPPAQTTPRKTRVLSLCLKCSFLVSMYTNSLMVENSNDYPYQFKFMWKIVQKYSYENQLRYSHSVYSSF